MAKLATSTKPKGKWICTRCGEKKPPTYFPTLTSKVCTACEQELAEALTALPEVPALNPQYEVPRPKARPSQPSAPPLSEPTDPAPFVSPDSEIDYKAPTNQELAARTLARRRLSRFIRRFRPKYMPGWMHEDICRRLERFMQAVADRKSPRLLILVPYRHGKSEIGSRHFAPFLFGHHPDWEIIAASNAQSLATSFSRYIRDLMRDPSYQALFPETRLDPSSQSVENWNTTAGGGYLAAGVGTAIIGRGADVLTIDDPVRDAEAADSQVIRDATWDWYMSTAYSRLAPGGGVLGILTCWNEDDWGGRIQQAMAAGGDQFEVVRYPAINDKGDEYILPNDEIIQVPPEIEPPPGARMTRPMNTALHPERYTLPMLEAIKRNYHALGQQRWWAAGYQQDPTPDEGVFFTKKMFMHYKHGLRRTNMNIFQAWDFAISDNQKSDWTVGVTVYQDCDDNLYVVDVMRFRSSEGEDIVQTVIDYANKWRPNTIGFEDGPIWKALKSTFERVAQTSGEINHFYPSYEVLVPLTDKRVRAQPLRGRMQAKKVWFDPRRPWYAVLEAEFLRFMGGGKHDDIVDAVAWAVRLVLNHAPPARPAPPVTKSWRDALMSDTDGASHMAA